MVESSIKPDILKGKKEKIFNDIGLSDLHATAQNILELSPSSKLFAIEGSLGAGKTTLIKKMCEVLGVTDLVNSPTFSLVHEYALNIKEKNDIPVYHLDFYRINSLEEVINMGYEQYIFSDNYCFIEWPSKIMELLPDDLVYIELEKPNDIVRTLTIHY